jgi:hypothetical protein
MGSEYFINSQELEDKIRQLLPSQGGAGAGFDLSASTQIIPIIDLTESASGSNLREDLQSSLSFGSVTAFEVAGSTSTIISNTGYWRIFGTCCVQANSGGAESASILINDGATSKAVWKASTLAIASVQIDINPIDFIVYLEAGDTLQMTSTNTANILAGSVRQIADIDGVLINP